MSLGSRDAIPRLLSELADADFRDGEAVPVPLDELAWALSRMTPEALERLSAFLLDLTKRSPLRTPAWDAYRIAIEALAADLTRSLR